MTEQDVIKLVDQIRETAFEVHRYFGPGHFERVYENALVHRLVKGGVELRQQAPITVHDEDGTVVGEYVADLVVEGTVLLELKSLRSLTAQHEAQLLNYLKATEIEVGLLLNFGLKGEVKRKVFDNNRKGNMDWLKARST